jgi:glycosyltransferase involved in cell wall biosynthesis
VRIAVYENLPPGGALRVSYQIGHELLLRGHQVDLYRLSTYSDKGSFDLAREAGVTHVAPYRPLWGVLDARLQQGYLFPRSYTLFAPLKRVHRQLAAQIRSNRYDVVLVNPDAMTGSPYALRWLDGVPTVYFCQEPPRVATERAIFQQHRRDVARTKRVPPQVRLAEDTVVLGRLTDEDYENAVHATTIVVNSVYSRERVWAAYARNAVVCYLGIDETRFAPASSNERGNEVLSVGAPVSLKGHSLVVESLARLPKSERPALRVVLPRPGGTEQLEDLARDRGVDLTVDAAIDEDALIERFQTAIATVCAARLEPFGLTAIESMGCGTAVVAVREGGFRESVIDGVTGILVEPEVEALAAGIARVAGDRRLAQTLGAAGRREVVAHWTWKRTVDQMEDILEDAIGR